MRMGRTIAEKREQLETSSERLRAREKAKRKKNTRLILAIVWIVAACALAGILIISFLNRESTDVNNEPTTIVVPYSPTIDVIDMDAAATGGNITSRMREYIGQAESDFRDLGYTPVKAVIPSGSIREVDFYLENYNGFIKLVIDRETAISVEDADRMIRYLAGRGITNFEYIDVRVTGKGYWK